MTGEVECGPARADELSQVAELHGQCLPTSVLSLLGRGFLQSFYRFCAASPLETVTVARRNGRLVAAAMVSSEPASLNTRLLFKSNLIWAVLTHFHVAGVRRAVFGGGEQMDAKPEMVALFTSEDARGLGVGARLVDAVLRNMSALGETCCFVRTFADENNPAYRFYVREGFAPAGVLNAHGEAFALLKKDLAQP